MLFCKNDKLLSSCERWSKIECDRTEKFWQPLYNSESKPRFVQPYNSFDDIKPYLMQLPKEIIEKAVFKILTKLGAVFPDVKNYSQEAIFQKCNVLVVDVEFKMEYYEMKKFVDNILYLISGANGEMYVYAAVARMMTVKSFALNAKKNQNDTIEKQLKEARESFSNGVRKVFESVKLIREINDHEKLILNSYASQLMREITVHYLQDTETPMATADGNKLLSGVKIDIFDHEIKRPQLLASIRFYVMVCRDLPYYADDAAEQNLLTKLKWLMKVTFPNEVINYEDKATQQRAINRWKNIGLHEKDFDLPTGTRWIGDINAYALELFSTLCYEIEEYDADEPSKKFQAFDQHYTKEILEYNEDLTEIYFKTWIRHLNYYYNDKKEFLQKLRIFIDIFPRNDTLTLMYISMLQLNEAETRNFFLLNQRDDDIVKLLRCLIQLSTEFENIRLKHSAINTRKGDYQYYMEILKNSAELSVTNLIPESLLWRTLLFFVKCLKNADFHDIFLIANDQCPWSKILLMYAASQTAKPDFVENIEAHAKKAGITIITTLAEVKEMND